MSLYKEEKPVIVSVQSIFSICNKIEENWRRILRNSNDAELFLYYCLIILGFPFVICLNIQVTNEIWNQTLNDTYVYKMGLYDWYINKYQQKILIVFIRCTIYYSLIFLVRKQVQEHENNKWKTELYSSYYYVYGVLGNSTIALWIVAPGQLPSL